MIRKLLDILVCPHCRCKPLMIENESSEGDELFKGDIRCSNCNASFRIMNGVPDFVSPNKHSASIDLSFGVQWELRREGQLAEQDNLRYGINIEKWIACLSQTLSFQKGTWVLDVGCGTADEIGGLAKLYPNTNFVGIDLTSEIFNAHRKSSSLPNLHFMRCDAHSPPFGDRSFQQVISLGVLHHTPDTRSVFDCIAPLIHHGGEFLIWLYPTVWEVPIFFPYYAVRDYLFLGQGHRLPKRFLLWAVRAFCSPSLLVGSRLYKSSVFSIFDNIVPEYQHRHSKGEIKTWFSENGFEVVNLWKYMQQRGVKMPFRIRMLALSGLHMGKRYQPTQKPQIDADPRQELLKGADWGRG